jgi:glycosyltransferase involved in cell wall biosynthesis
MELRPAELSLEQPNNLLGLSVIIPVYNEEEGVCDVLFRINTALEPTGVPFEILVVDDGSTDNSSEAVRSSTVRQTSPDCITLLRHPFNKGYGAALKTGIRRARFDTIAIIDADGTYPPDSLLALLDHWGCNDMVVGARIGAEAAIPLSRRPAKWVLNQVANYLTGVKIPDLNSGLRVFKKSIALQFFKILPAGFSFTTTITLAMLSHDYLVEYVPIEYLPRVGRSKIRPIRDTLNFLSLILRTIMYYAPLKVFIPVSLFFLLPGFVKTLFDTIGHQMVTKSDLLLLVTGTIVAMLGLLADLIDKRS